MRFLIPYKKTPTDETNMKNERLPKNYKVTVKPKIGH